MNIRLSSYEVKKRPSMGAVAFGGWMIAKAPWQVDMDSLDKQWKNSISIKDAEGGHVAHLTRGYDSGPSWANARLIAAAPDLLEALNKARAYVVSADGDIAERIGSGYTTAKPDLEMIDAAIKKATGS